MLNKSIVVIMDLEYTAWTGSQENDWGRAGEYKEIVEIGAVKVDTKGGYREISSYSQLVKPKLNPVLSDYFIDLTGISQDMLIKDGVAFGEAHQTFVSFVSDDAAEILSYGGDGNVFLANCDINNISPHFIPNMFVNIYPKLRNQLNLGSRKIFSGELPSFVGLNNSQTTHRALDDARAIALTLAHLSQQATL